MTELETLQRAKMYLDKMANGIDPLTDTPVSDGDCINQIRITRCLFYVSGVLGKLIERGGFVEKPPKKKKTSFAITPEQLNRYVPDEVPISVSEITKRINDLIDPDVVTKLKYSSITSYLVKCGYLVEREFAEGKKTKVPTERGKAIGITREERQGLNGSYHITLYDAEAQRLILDNMNDIIAMNNRPQGAEGLQWQPWTSIHDETLVDLYNKKVPLSEIAITLQRTESAILARLKKLGIT